MRHFAEELRGEGYRVRYTRIDDRDNAGSFSGEVQRALNDLTPSRFASPKLENGASSQRSSALPVPSTSRSISALIGAFLPATRSSSAGRPGVKA